MFKAKKELAACKAEYEAQLAKQREAIESLTERNRAVEAELSAYRAKEKAIADSLIAASAQREAMAIREAEIENASERSNALLAQKCRALLDSLLQKYPEEGDVKQFEAFVSELEATLSEDCLSEPEEGNISSDELANPKKDLASRCKELGVME